jgi:hypothetical protein
MRERWAGMVYRHLRARRSHTYKVVKQRNSKGAAISCGSELLESVGDRIFCCTIHVIVHRVDVVLNSAGTLACNARCGQPKHVLLSVLFLIITVDDRHLLSHQH